MTTRYEPGQTILVRTGGGNAVDAEVIEDRGGTKVRVLFGDGAPSRVLRTRCCPKPAVRAPMLPRTDVAALVSVTSPHPALRAVPKPPSPWRSEHRCCARGLFYRCSGPIVAHHHGPRGTGQKTDDSRVDDPRDPRR